MLLAGVAVQLLIACAFATRARGESAEWLPGQSFVEGQHVFEAAGCRGCHGMLGQDGGAAPDLRHGKAWTDLMQLAGSLWNHAPVAHEHAPLSPDDAGKLAGYLFQLNFVDRPGDVAQGRALFEQRSCARCHQLGGHGGTVGPRLDELVPYASGLFLAQALWNHGPRMAAKMAELGIERPLLDADDLDHLLAFMRGTAGVAPGLEHIAAQSGSPRAGKTVFARQGCVRCHAIGGVGGDVGPDLGTRRSQWRLAEVVAALWNHGPTMWAKMEEQHMAVPQLGDREMADLLAYLFFVQFANPDGDPVRGAALFRDKSCALCHGGGGDAPAPGPSLAGSAATRSPLHWTAAMWSHAPAMVDRLHERGIAWPRFAEDEMRDLVAFLRAPGEGR